MRKLSLLLILSILSTVTAKAATDVTQIGFGNTDLGLSSSYSMSQASDATKGWNLGGFTWMGGSYGLTASGFSSTYDDYAYYESYLQLPSDATITVTFTQSIYSFTNYGKVSFADIYSQGSGFVVRTEGETDWTYIKPACTETATSGPISAEVSLSAYSGKTVQIGF